MLTVDAPGVRVEGLRIVGSGSSHETIDSGVKLTKAARGARVRAQTTAGTIDGITDGLTPGGALRVRTQAGLEEVFTGELVRVWRRA